MNGWGKVEQSRGVPVCQCDGGMRVDNIVEDGVDDFGCCVSPLVLDEILKSMGGVRAFGEFLRRLILS